MWNGGLLQSGGKLAFGRFNQVLVFVGILKQVCLVEKQRVVVAGLVGFAHRFIHLCDVIVGKRPFGFIPGTVFKGDSTIAVAVTHEMGIGLFSVERGQQCAVGQLQLYGLLQVVHALVVLAGGEVGCRQVIQRREISEALMLRRLEEIGAGFVGLAKLFKRDACDEGRLIVVEAERFKCYSLLIANPQKVLRQ